MTALVVFCVDTVSDREALARYRQEGRPMLAAHGGRFLAGPAIAATLEGAPFETAAVVEFPSVEAAQGWYDSPDYQRVLGIRTGASAGRAFIIAGRDA